MLAGRWFGVPGCILAIVLTWSATPASAVGWRLTGTGSPAAGESATYLLRPPSAGATVHYRLLVFTGVRACAGNGVGGDPALTTEREGYLDPGQGGHAENLSFARGQSTICLASGLPRRSSRGRSSAPATGATAYASRLPRRPTSLATSTSRPPATSAATAISRTRHRRPSSTEAALSSPRPPPTNDVPRASRRATLRIRHRRRSITHGSRPHWSSTKSSQGPRSARCAAT